MTHKKIIPYVIIGLVIAALIYSSNKYGARKTPSQIVPDKSGFNGNKAAAPMQYSPKDR